MFPVNGPYHTSDEKGNAFEYDQRISDTADLSQQGPSMIEYYPHGAVYLVAV